MFVRLFVFLCLFLFVQNAPVATANVTGSCEELCSDRICEGVMVISAACVDEECLCECDSMTRPGGGSSRLCNLDPPNTACEDFCTSECGDGNIMDNHCVDLECHCTCADLSFSSDEGVCLEEEDNDESDSVCFSSETTALVWGKGFVKMDELKVGDKVLTSTSGKYDTIYSLDHRSPTKLAEFVQIFYGQEEPLELTEKHMLFVDGTLNPVPARTVKVGDKVLTTNGPQLVTKVSSVTREGVFNPLTADGTIVANGVLTSTYSAFVGGDSGWATIAGYKVMTEQDFYTGILKPYSYICMAFASYELCEAKVNNGRDAQLAAALQFLYHYQKQHDLYKFVVGSSLVMLAFVFSVVCSHYSIFFALTAVIGWRMNVAKANKA